MPRPTRVPTYRLHKPSGQAVVTIRDSDGTRRDVYLGAHNSPESKAEYARIIAELAAAATADQVLPAGTAAGPSKARVCDVLAAFWLYAQGHYRRADGTRTNEVNEYRQSFKPVRKLYGTTLAKDFGPLSLKTVRAEMVGKGLSRKLVNQRIGRIKRAFKWAASEQLVPVAVYQGLTTVTGLQRGRTAAPDRDPVAPVAIAHVLPVLRHVLPPVAAMVELQLLTGMRPGEVCAARPCDIDTSGDVWLYRPAQHKTSWRGKARVVAIGPKGQEILARFAPADATAYYFSPAAAVAEFHAGRGEKRATPKYPSHMARNARKRKRRPARSPRRCYDASAYGHAVLKGIGKANAALVEAGVEVELHIPNWSPNRLRHAHATAVRAKYGLEAAQVALGHSHANVTEIYAERNVALAVRVARENG